MPEPILNALLHPLLLRWLKAYRRLQIEQDLESAANSEHYFLFEEALRAVLLAVSREPRLGPSCLHAPFPRLVGVDGSGDSQGAYPPSSLLPCR